MARRRSWSTLSPPLGTSLLAAVLTFSPSAARAAGPLCFPERTVMFAAEVRDEQGRVLGGVRAGQVVHLIDDSVGQEGAEALVEVQTPARFRGFVPQKKLHVFLKHDQPLDPGWVWRLAETPVRIVGPADQGVLVTWIEGHGKDSTYPPQQTACRDLTGIPAGKLYISDCSGAWPDMERQPAGKRAHLSRDVKVLRGPQAQPIRNGELAGLLRTEGNEALVEVVQQDMFFEPLRIHAWIDRKAVTLGPPEDWTTSGHGCCEGALDVDVRGGQPGATLAEDVELRAEPGMAPFVRVPKGNRFRVLDRGQGDMRRVVFMWPSWDLDTFQAVLMGWAPIAALPPTEKPRWQRAVFGRLQLPDAKAPADFTGYRVSMLDPLERVTVEGKVAREGRFEIWVPSPKGMVPRRQDGLGGAVRIEARSPDGKLAGAARATPLLGGGEEVTVTLQPAVKIEGRVKNLAGAWLPGERVAVAAAGYGITESATATTDAQGRFVVSVAPGHYVVYPTAAAGITDVTPPATDVELWKHRRGILFGSVNAKSGHCAGRKVEVRCPSRGQLVPLRADCTFVVTETPEENCSPAIELAGVADPRAEPVSVWREDHRAMPVCRYEKECAGEWQQTSLYVSVTGVDQVLTSREANVEVKLPTGATESCQTVKGTCYVHHLPASGTVTVEARQGNRVGSTSVKLAPGVVETLVKVPFN